MRNIINSSEIFPFLSNDLDLVINTTKNYLGSTGITFYKGPLSGQFIYSFTEKFSGEIRAQLYDKDSLLKCLLHSSYSMDGE